jgi:predicted nucleotidyltransferase
MPLPEFDHRGDLPLGVHPATIKDVVERFGHGTPQREVVTSALQRVYEVARRTGKLERFALFGSYVTSKPAPNDIDIILIMRDDFREEDYTEDLLPVLDHQRAQSELGASIFWIRSRSILLESVDEFVARWQIKRDLTQRGIVEIVEA